MQQMARCAVPRKSLGDLACRPFGGGMSGHVEMNHPASVVGEHDEDKQDPKGNRRHYEEICRNQLGNMIVEEGAPSLRWGSPCVHHVPGDSCPGHIDS